MILQSNNLKKTTQPIQVGLQNKITIALYNQKAVNKYT